MHRNHHDELEDAEPVGHPVGDREESWASSAQSAGMFKPCLFKNVKEMYGHQDHPEQGPEKTLNACPEDGVV